ncbi:hypothetical protein APHAL10511_000913 [Amanita phalloides]|nr:hypothetical protein APHAL10511_000913 [Amanita phalloides]
MNSPGSPTFSTPSSESPPPEDTHFPPSQNTAQLSQLITQVAASLSSSGNPTSPTVTAGPSTSGSHHGSVGVPSSKRRQPQGASYARDRDAKTRRREPRAGGVWEPQGGKEGGRKDKDEFIDTHIAENLRKDIGDPFLEIES